MIRILFFFFIYSFIGWIAETINILIREKKLVNRGFLIGPYLPIYGVGAVLTILLIKTNNYILIFFESALICSVVEYLMSYICEVLFEIRYWDYSNRKFNINGRVCLFNMVLFGIGCILIKLINPIFDSFINTMDYRLLLSFVLVMSTLFIIDSVITLYVLFKIKDKVDTSLLDDTKNIKNGISNYLQKSSYLYKRFYKSYKHFQIDINKKIKKLEKRRKKHEKK